MELIDGSNLSERIKREQEKGIQFQEKELWKILINMCSVLQYLHYERSIIHRDINPTNILVDNNFNIKLADFGLAKTFQRGIKVNQSFVGTPAYSCPEILQNKPYTEKADIWALGCIMYELIMLKPAFSGSNALQMAKKIVTMEYEHIPQGRASRKMIELVELCMEKDCEKRLNIIQLIKFISKEVMRYLDHLKFTEIALNSHIKTMTRKVNNLMGS